MAKSTSKTKRTFSSKSKSTVENEPSMSETLTADDGLEELLLDSIKDIYWAENHLLKALPKMQKAAGSEQLQKAFTDHLLVTKGHVSRLENVFEMMDEKKLAKKCDAMEGIVTEGEGIIDDTYEGTLSRDIGLIHAARKVENYEMTNYKGIIQLAKALGKDDVANLLAENLKEEMESDDLLATIAENQLSSNGSNVMEA